MSYAIITDTSANLPTPWLRGHQVDVLPFTYCVDGLEGQCLDTEGFDDVGFYTRIQRGAKVSTSQISPQNFAALFRRRLEQGEDVLFVSMSSGISGSWGSAEMAASELRERFPERTIEIVDTLGASLGEGLLVLRAVEDREKGVDLGENARRLRESCGRMVQVFTGDDLLHLCRNGRLSNVNALVGSMLGIKPILKGDPQGKIVACGKVRGRKNAIGELAKRYETLVSAPEAQTVGIAHANCPQDAQTLASLLRSHRPPREILTVKYEPVTGSHVGPGALALFFLGEPGAREK